ncbi:hypothetical protein [Streptomyces griseiscabiei]|uniref:Glycoside hydrolase family 65 n=1 Tax=Streptomyces griseiscabiei TaxID=2993540 RepID=A0ABU4L4B2_9ACTN|nr:hypothetical protein [Streptomyces griseiscabiei]MBZ3905491.1 hypothetical protein [Streptomyces griseiscabiei]MDX2910582.1 hypothetical protein [Streptomyces griseiscabiei]
MIDRKSLVRRHTVRLTEPDPAHVLTVGNGDFAYSCDITGMQSFPAYHDQAAAAAERRLAVNTATMSTWGWHAMPNPEGYTLPDAMSEHNTARGKVSYPDRFGIAAMMSGDLPEEMRPGAWLSANPQRLDLGRIGLLLRPAPDAEPETGPGALRDTEQCLDLWTGTISGRFRYADQEVAVTTVADPHGSRVAFRIESELLADGLAGVVVRFPYASDGFFQTCDWTSPERHRTDLAQVTDTGCVFRRTLDDTTYAVRLTWSAGVVRPTGNPHEYLLTTDSDTLELVAAFSPDDGEVPSVEADFACLAAASATWWEDFWTSGAALDLTGSTDPRAAELERRVVLSQYLTAVNCSGTLPPQETGLITNSWHGKHHVEMHWWHAAHFATWGRPELLERSLDWYLSILPEARATARRQRYDGARWPKQTGPDGRESPSDIGVFLIWQQPHPLYLLELLHRARPESDVVTRFAELVEDTAAFMASFAEERDGAYHLPAPLLPAQEFYDATTTEDPTFELAYWWWGLEIAQRWRERTGRERDKRWQRVQDGLALPHRRDGRYTAVATEPYLKRDDHPSLLCALGVVPDTPLVDPDVMAATLQDVRADWEWNSAWGWDFPVMAMTATRVGRPDLAVDALLMRTPKNHYLPTGHAPQIGSFLPIYLPSNGALLAAVSLMAGGWDGADRDCPGFPAEGWTVRHEGFTPWP